MLDVVDLTKRYGDVTALDNVSFTIEPGEVVALLGPNGSGKTTLMSVIVGLTTSDGGVLGLDGDYLPPARTRSMRAAFGFAAQEIALYPDLTVRQNLGFFSRVNSAPGIVGDRALTRAVRVFRLEDLLDRKVATLSGGQKRRVHAAVAILGAPRIVLLDEPSAGMDAESRDTLLNGVRELAADGLAVIYSTHYLAEVETLAPRLLILVDGTIAADGTAAALLAGHRAKVRVEFVSQRAAESLGYASAEQQGDTVLIDLDEARDIGQVLARMTDPGCVRSVGLDQPSIERLYDRLVEEHHVAPV